MIRLFESVRRNFQLSNLALTQQYNKRQGFIVVETNYRVYAYTGKHIIYWIVGKIIDFFSRITITNSIVNIVHRIELSFSKIYCWSYNT